MYITWDFTCSLTVTRSLLLIEVAQCIKCAIVLDLTNGYTHSFAKACQYRHTQTFDTESEELLQLSTSTVLQFLCILGINRKHEVEDLVFDDFVVYHYSITDQDSWISFTMVVCGPTRKFRNRPVFHRNRIWSRLCNWNKRKKLYWILHRKSSDANQRHRYIDFFLITCTCVFTKKGEGLINYQCIITATNNIIFHSKNIKDYGNCH